MLLGCQDSYSRYEIQIFEMVRMTISQLAQQLNKTNHSSSNNPDPYDYVTDTYEAYLTQDDQEFIERLKIIESGTGTVTGCYLQLIIERILSELSQISVTRQTGAKKIAYLSWKLSISNTECRRLLNDFRDITSVCDPRAPLVAHFYSVKRNRRSKNIPTSQPKSNGYTRLFSWLEDHQSDFHRLYRHLRRGLRSVALPGEILKREHRVSLPDHTRRGIRGRVDLFLGTSLVEVKSGPGSERQFLWQTLLYGLAVGSNILLLLVDLARNQLTTLNLSVREREMLLRQIRELRK
jgi:hypothetical protein